MWFSLKKIEKNFGLKNFLFVHFLTKKVNKMIGSESLGFVKMYTEILSNEVNAGK